MKFWFRVLQIKKCQTPPKLNNNKNLSKKRKITSSPLSYNISSKTSQNNNYRKNHYTQGNTKKCVKEDDIDTENEEMTSKRKSKLMNHLKVQI